MFIKSAVLNFGSMFFQILNQVRKIYLNSPIYNKIISKIDDKVIIYKPSQNILNCLKNESNEIKISHNIATMARKSVQRMTEIGR